MVLTGALYVYWSADDFADVPIGVVTVTSTVPADSAGAVAIICESTEAAFAGVTDVAGGLPNSTQVSPGKA